MTPADHANLCRDIAAAVHRGENGVALLMLAVAEERERIASLLEHSADCMDECAPRCVDEPESVSLRKLADAIRSG